ncbi:MAG: hypothetical protein NZT92_10110, partial [Abditibacteriales bacterium]|nr:hypothetical protein [Abditibacteriales bacterium]
MAHSLSDPRWQVVQDNYPFPIAFILQAEVRGAATPRDQAEGLIRLSNTTLQYAALVAASNYAAAPFKEEKVSYRFERLKRPLLSDFAHFLRVSVPALEQQGVLFVPELATAVAQADRERVRALHMGERGLEERALSLLEALVNLRNALAHDRYRGEWETFVEHHTPLVACLLHLLDWCAQYPLLRLVGAGQWVRLKGAEPTFATEPIPDAALPELARAQREGELTGLLLADPTHTRFLTLDPFILWADCPYCEQEPLVGLTEEVFLFNGDEGRRYLAYVGIRHPRPMSPPKQRMEQIYAEKEVPPEPCKISQLTYPLLYSRACRQNEMWLRENINARRYIPQVYHPRKGMESQLEGFLRGRKAGFLLLGEAGIGKTNLLCHKVEEWRERGEIVLFYAGHQLLVTRADEASDELTAPLERRPPGASSLRRTGEAFAEPLEGRLLRDLHLTGDFPELLDFLRREGRRIILVVDGVNEHPHAPALLQHLCTFTARYAAPLSRREEAGAEVKVILSFRAAFFQKTLQALFAAGGDEASLFPLAVFQSHTVEEQGRKVETYRFTLERVDEEELEAIYEAYRAYAGRPDPVTGAMVRFCPRTPFQSLSRSVRAVLTHPWYLRMVMEAYDGKQIPRTLWTGEILKAFCEAKIYGRTPDEQERFAARADLVEELVALMSQQATDTFRRDELHDLSPRWSRILLENEVARSPYLQLVDEGVLIEVPDLETIGRRTRTRYLIRFAFDPLFEYLLSEDILRVEGGWENLTGEHLVSWLIEGIRFDHLIGAVEFLLIESAQQGNFALLADTLNAAEVLLALPVFVQVLTTLEGMGDENFQPLVKHLADNAEADKACRVLLRASYEFSTKQRHRPFLFCSDMAREVAQRAVNEGREELANALAGALMNKGVALRELGQPAEALACHDEAIERYRHLVEAEG